MCSAICDSFVSYTWKKNLIERRRKREREREIGWLMWRNILSKHARMNLLFYSSNLNASMRIRMMAIIYMYTIFFLLHFRSICWIDDDFPFYWSLSCLLLNTSVMYILTLIRVDSTICNDRRQENRLYILLFIAAFHY